MGLFIDDNNIPISYKLFPGNHIDQTTLRPTLKKTINKMGYDRVIIVGDGGVNSGKNIAHIVGEGDGYILSKSTRRANKKEKEWILDDSGFRWTGKDKAFKIKSEIREREVLDENGNKRVIKEKFITYWSKKHYKYECKENRKFIEYLDAVCDFPDKLKDKENKLNKYLKKTNVVKGTGEVVKTKVRYTLDKEKLERDLSLMGYYNLMTSEVKMPDEEVIKKYKGLSKIENSFRVIKSDLEGRPVYVRTASHINAHFLICFIALTMIRIIQHKVLKYQGKKTNRLAKWEEGLSANKIKEALNNFTATRLPGDYFMVSQKSEDLSLILKSFNLEKPINLPSLEMLRQYRFNIKK
jgi:transposase